MHPVVSNWSWRYQYELMILKRRIYTDVMSNCLYVDTFPKLHPFPTSFWWEELDAMSYPWQWAYFMLRSWFPNTTLFLKRPGPLEQRWFQRWGRESTWNFWNFFCVMKLRRGSKNWRSEKSKNLSNDSDGLYSTG